MGWALGAVVGFGDEALEYVPDQAPKTTAHSVIGTVGIGVMPSNLQYNTTR